MHFILFCAHCFLYWCWVIKKVVLTNGKEYLFINLDIRFCLTMDEARVFVENMHECFDSQKFAKCFVDSLLSLKAREAHDHDQDVRLSHIFDRDGFNLSME